MQAEAEFFSRFFALSLIEESHVVEAIAKYFKRPGRFLQDSPNQEIGAAQIKRAIVCYQNQRKKINFTDKLKWNFHFLKWQKAEVPVEDWLKFRASTSEENFLAVLLGLVMRVGEKDLLEALQITEGTLRFRYSDGLNDLVKIRSHAKYQN